MQRGTKQFAIIFVLAVLALAVMNYISADISQSSAQLFNFGFTDKMRAPVKIDTPPPIPERSSSTTSSSTSSSSVSSRAPNEYETVCDCDCMFADENGDNHPICEVDFNADGICPIKIRITDVGPGFNCTQDPGVTGEACGGWLQDGTEARGTLQHCKKILVQRPQC